MPCDPSEYGQQNPSFIQLICGAVAHTIASLRIKACQQKSNNTDITGLICTLLTNVKITVEMPDVKGSYHHSHNTLTSLLNLVKRWWLTRGGLNLCHNTGSFLSYENILDGKIGQMKCGLPYTNPKGSRNSGRI